MNKQTAQDIWNQLNSRQQKYLEIIYQADQDVEQFEKSSWIKGRERRPASVWRWLFYGDINDRPSPLKSRLLRAGLVDNGTGSTLDALERRTLIECNGSVPHLYIKATRLGRKVVRTGTKEPIVKRTRTPKGMLSQKAWLALVLIGKAGKEGIHLGANQYSEGIHINVWNHLQKHDPPLIQGHSQLHYTVFGALFYIHHYKRYREIYPDVDAPRPRYTADVIARKIKAGNRRQLLSLIRLKQGARSLEEVAAEVGVPVSVLRLSQLENDESIQPERLERIVDWIVRER